MTYAYISRRHDGSFEIDLNGLPCHVTESNPLFAGLVAEHGDIPAGMALVAGALLEDHRYEFGWLNGEPTQIKDFGPLPDGWSTTPPPPPPPSLAEARRRTVAAVNNAFEAACSALLADEPPSVTATFGVQESEARAWRMDSATPTPMLDALAEARGLDKAELISRVLIKADLYKRASGALLGKQQRLVDDVAAIMASDLADELKIAALQQLDIAM